MSAAALAAVTDPVPVHPPTATASGTPAGCSGAPPPSWPS